MTSADPPHRPSLLLRPLLVIGLAALLLAGAHAAADRLDDLAFTVISGMDAVLDALSSGLIEAFGPLLRLSSVDQQRWAQAAEGLIDLDRKIALARGVALLLEALIALLLALPLLNPGIGLATVERVRVALSAMLHDPTALLLAAPTATLLAALAGGFVVAHELEAATRAFIAERGLSTEVQRQLPVALGLVGFLASSRLGARASLRALVRARALSERDRERGKSVARRRARGLFLLVAALPAAAMAFFDLFFAALGRLG